MTEMTSREREELAELIAIKVAEKYESKMQAYVGTQIKLHSYQCAAGKFAWLKSLISAITGGVIVGLVLWWIKRP